MRGMCVVTSGMCGLWDSTHFPMVYDEESWYDALGDDSEVVRHTVGGYFVPVRLNTPGVFEYEVRWGTATEPADLSERERGLLAVSSRKYLFRSSGGLCFGDYRHLEAVASDKVGYLELPAGEYVAQIHILAWDDEPGAEDERGHRNDGTLPDLLIVLNPASLDFRAPGSLQTFTR